MTLLYMSVWGQNVGNSYIRMGTYSNIEAYVIRVGYLQIKASLVPFGDLQIKATWKQENLTSLRLVLNLGYVF